MIFYGSRESGHSYKVRLFLVLADIPYVYREVDLSVPGHLRPAEFRAVSPFGEVPVLVHQGSPLAQSNAILLFLARSTGRFGPPPGTTWDALTMWLFWEANRVGFSVANLRFARRFARGTPLEVVAWIRHRALADLDRLELQLAGRTFLLGDAPSIADLSSAGYLFWADQAGLELGRWPAVRAWLARIRGLPRFQEPDALMAA